MKTLPPNALQYAADYVRTIWHVEVDPVISVNDLLSPGFWAHHAARLKRGDLVEVVNSELTLDVSLRVHDVDQGMVTMAVRFDASVAADEGEEGEEGGELEAPAPANLPKLPDGYRLHHNPRAAEHKWRSIWTEPNPPVTVLEGDTKLEVIEAAIAHHAKATGAAA